MQKTFTFQERALFALETVPVNQVKINICDLQDSTDNTTSCSTQVEARVKELASHTVLGPLLSSLRNRRSRGAGTGALPSGRRVGEHWWQLRRLRELSNSLAPLDRLSSNCQRSWTRRGSGNVCHL